MTKILVRKTSTGAYTGFTCIGHSGFAQAGNDIVCASISVLIINAINSIEQFAKATLASGDSFKKVVVFEIPKGRAYMHLDTVFTQVDVYKFTVYPGIIGGLKLYELTLAGDGSLRADYVQESLE